MVSRFKLLLLYSTAESYVILVCFAYRIVCSIRILLNELTARILFHVPTLLVVLLLKLVRLYMLCQSEDMLNKQVNLIISFNRLLMKSNLTAV